MPMVEKLAYVKRKAGLTSEDISRRSGVPLGTVNKIFAGQTRNPSPLSLDRICMVLQIPMRYLLDDAIPVDACIGACVESGGLQMLSERQCQLVDDYALLSEHGRQTIDVIMDLLLAQTPRSFPLSPYQTLICCQIIARGQRSMFGDSFHLRPLHAYVDSVVKQADFALLLADQSMYPVYASGTILALKREAAGNNQLGAFLINREVYVRKLYHSRKKRKLVSVNLEYKDVVLTDHDEYQCLGTVIGAVRNYYWL